MATQEDYICRVESGFLIKISDRLLCKHGSDILHGVQWKKPGTMHASVSLSCIPCITHTHKQVQSIRSTRPEHAWTLSKKYMHEFCCTLVTHYVYCSIHLHTIASAHAAQLTWWDSVLQVPRSRLRLHDTAPLQPTEQQHPPDLPSTAHHRFFLCASPTLSPTTCKLHSEIH